MEQIAREAGALMLRRLARVGRVDAKTGAGIVTAVDLACERLLVRAVRRRFPGDAILSEEMGGARGKRAARWIIDPLDGTSNYAHGTPWFSVSIAREAEGEIVEGVVHNPCFREMFYARRGGGACVNGRRLRVSRTRRMRRGLFGTGFYYHKRGPLRREIRRFSRVQEASLGVRRFGSAALDLCAVAAGRYDGFWERGLSPWDVAAGILLVREAGGKVTTYEGNPYAVGDATIVASNGVLHGTLRRAITGR